LNKIGASMREIKIRVWHRMPKGKWNEKDDLSADGSYGYTYDVTSHGYVQCIKMDIRRGNDL